MIKCIPVILVLVACRSDPGAKGSDVEIVPDGGDDSASGSVSPKDDDTGEAPVGPIGAWSTCTGDLVLMEGAFTWEGVGGMCSLAGSSRMEDESLVLEASDYSDCPQPPWWMEIFRPEPAVFAASVSGSRLTIVPSRAVQTTRVAHFEENLDSEWWLLTAAEGHITHALFCSVEGTFFGGYYEDPEETCEFLSCAGQILGVTYSGSEEHWSTVSGGDCPGSGILTIESRSETSVTGRYFASNCARIFQSTFTGVPL
jgi:hypothetical protein